MAVFHIWSDTELVTIIPFNQLCVTGVIAQILGCKAWDISGLVLEIVGVMQQQQLSKVIDLKKMFI